MKKNMFLLTALLVASLSLLAQEKKLYNPAADAKADIEAAVKKASAENKFVVLQAGGNWCSWCLEFAKISKANPQIDSLINSSFVWYELNFSKENKNEDILAKYGYPQRFGFPVFIILDAKGQRMHTQNSEYLEDGKKSYDQKKVFEFLQKWTPASLAAENNKY
jgi:thioredoxin-related protein